jgi:preprotein translocase subunit SecE
MGRILKKKDPIKKKAQRTGAGDNGAEAPRSGGDTSAVKVAPAIRKSTGPDKSRAAAATEPNFLQKSSQFLREVKIELKKVTWPTRKQTMGSTVVVVVLVMIFSLFLGLVDLSLSSLIRYVLP